MGTMKLLTLDDLVKFCSDHNFAKFSASESGYELRVQVPARFEVDDSEEDSHRGLMKLLVKAFHVGVNRNGSAVSEEAAKDAMATMSYRPILANIHQLDDGSWDFQAHDMEIDEDNDEPIYIEKQIGAFGAEDAFFEDDPSVEGKKFVCKYAYIPEEYTKACDIIREKGGTKVSVELAIEEMSYSAKDMVLNLDKFYVAGCTCLGAADDGTPIEEGMKGARADIIEDFKADNNSAISDYQKLSEQIKEVENKINTLFNEKGGSEMNKLEELLAKYSASIEDLPFAEEVEGMTDEELEAKFAEFFADDDPVSDPVENGDDSESDPETDPEAALAAIENGEEPTELGANLISADDQPNTVQYSCTMGEFVRTFEISLEDKIYALSNLVNAAYADEDTWYQVECYDSHVVMIDWWNNKAYKQDYSENEEGVFELVGERVEVFSRWLTEQEIHDLEVLQTNFSALETKYNALVEENENAAREAVFADEAYAKIAETEEWKELKKNAGKYSAKDLATEADAIYGRYCRKANAVGSIGISHRETKKTPYGSLFS